MTEVPNRLKSLFADSLWMVVPPMALFILAVLSFELFIFHPQDMERLLLRDGIRPIPDWKLIAFKSGELPRRIIYLGSSIVYTVTFIVGCVFYFFVVRSGLCKSHTNRRPLRQPNRLGNDTEIWASNIAYAIIVVLSVILFFSIRAWAEDIRFVHHEIHRDFFAAIKCRAGSCTNGYFAPNFQLALSWLTGSHYVMGFISGSLTLLAFAATAVAPPSSVNTTRYWQSQVRRLQYVAFAGSFIILTGVVLMGSRFQWTAQVVGSALNAREDIGSYPTIVVAYWAVVMSSMLLVAYLTVVWRLLANGVRLSLGTEIRSAMALFAPIAGSIITAIF